MSSFSRKAVTMPPDDILQKCKTFTEYERCLDAWYGKGFTASTLLVDPSPAFLEALQARFPELVIAVSLPETKTSISA